MKKDERNYNLTRVIKFISKYKLQIFASNLSTFVFTFSSNWKSQSLNLAVSSAVFVSFLQL
jgi:hypothetical protein